MPYYKQSNNYKGPGRYQDTPRGQKNAYMKNMANNTKAWSFKPIPGKPVYTKPKIGPRLPNGAFKSKAGTKIRNNNVRLRTGQIVYKTIGHFKKMPKNDKVQKINNVVTRTFRLTSPIGQQGVGAFTSSFISQDLENAFAQFTTYATNSGTATQDLHTYSIHCHRVTTLAEFANATALPVKITFYEVQSREDNQSSTNDPATDWATGMTDQGYSGGVTTPGVTPFQTPYFCERWKVINSNAYLIDPGANFIRKLVHNGSNRYINRNRYYHVNGSTTSFRNFTTYTFVVLQGGIENDSTTKTQVSYGASAINTIVTQTYEFYANPVSSKTEVITNNLPTSFSVGGEAIEELTGAITTDITA